MTCGSQLAADQRYCLQCGQRQGEPRLPFMDATSMMDVAVQRRQPPAAAPTPPRRGNKQRVSANTALIAGVGTLLLALGIGVLIGKTGNHSAATTAAAPQIIKVGGGETAGATASTAGATTSSAKKKSDGGKGKSAGAKASSSGQTAAAADILNPTKKLPPPEVKVGDKGSGPGFNKKHEFTGNFFGE